MTAGRMLAVRVVGMVPDGMVVRYGGVFSLHLAGSIAEHVCVVAIQRTAASDAPAVEMNTGMGKGICRV